MALKEVQLMLVYFEEPGPIDVGSELRGLCGHLEMTEELICPQIFKILDPKRDPNGNEILFPKNEQDSLPKVYAHIVPTEMFADCSRLGFQGMLNFKSLAVSQHLDINSLDVQNRHVTSDNPRFRNVAVFWTATKTVGGRNKLRVSDRKSEQRYVLERAKTAFAQGCKVGEQQKYGEALEYYAEARDIYRQYGTELDVAYVEVNMGNVLRRQGHYEEAIRIHSRCRDVYASHGKADHVAQSEANLANVFMDINCYEKALAALKEARRNFKLLSVWFFAATASMDMGSLLRNLGRHQEALQCFEQAKQEYQEHGAEREAAMCDVGIALVLSSSTLTAGDVKNWKKSISLIEKARETFVRLKLPASAANCDLNMADLFLEMEEPEKALQLLERALDFFDTESQANFIWRCKYGIARARRSLGDFRYAFYNLESAIADIEDLRGDINTGQLKVPYFINKGSVYSLMVRMLCLDLDDETWELLKQESPSLPSSRLSAALEYVESAKSRVLSELAKRTDPRPRERGGTLESLS